MEKNMNNNATQENLKKVKEKTESRIHAGRDPRIAHWQGALESILVMMEKYLVPGQIITVESLKPNEAEVFQTLHTLLDISPFVNAVFLPPSIANAMNPSEIADSIKRVPKENPSYMVLISKIRDYNRILAAEISPHPAKPGVDIFEDGSLLGSYNYNTPEECIKDLSKVIWIHLKFKEKWSEKDFVSYTEGWFSRSADALITDLPINPDCSYIHHPVLLNISEVKAIFKLMKATLAKLFADPDNVIRMANTENQYDSSAIVNTRITSDGILQGKEDESKSLHYYIENRLLELLKLLRGYEIIDFQKFSESEQTEFKNAFDETVDQTYKMLKDRLS